MDILRNPNKRRRPILKHEIINAQKQARSAAEAARMLEVSYHTYVKYAKLYGIHNFINKAGKGIPKPKIHDARYPMDAIFANKFPNYDILHLKARLISSGYLPEKCNLCGFAERRIIDNKIPLLLVFKDGNRKNMALENLELKCFNCAFLTVGNLNRIRTHVERIDNFVSPSHDENLIQKDMIDEAISEAKKELENDNEI